MSAQADAVAQAKFVEDAAVVRWQTRLLPFMIGSLIVVGLTFIASTLWFFHDLEQRLEWRQTDVVSVLDKLGSQGAPAADPQSYRDWYVRATLESVALQQRFNVQATVVKGRLWTRFMGFLTGMLLALTGCVFVLGKMREPVDFTGEGQGMKVALAASPGVFLSLIGAILIGISLVVETTVELSDMSIFLPRQAENVRVSVAGQGERSPPAPLGTDSGSNAGKIPPSVLQHVEQVNKANLKAVGK
jgi:hypothetical protein